MVVELRLQTVHSTPLYVVSAVYRTGEVGIEYLAVELICEISVEINGLIATSEVETTSVFGSHATNDSYIVLIDLAVFVGILVLRHTGECFLTISKRVVFAAMIGCYIAVLDTVLQCPYTIYYVEIIHLVESICLITDNQTYRLAFSDNVRL